MDWNKWEGYVQDVCNKKETQDGGDGPAVPKFQLVRSLMQRAWSEAMSPIPATVDDVVIEGLWTETWAQGPFLMHTENDCGIAVFATEENPRQLQQYETIYKDTTFKFCPRP